MRREHVADRLREVATLIGKLQNDEVALASGQTVVPGLGIDESADALIERADRLENGSLRLAVVGSSMRGKSRLVNALLGENLLLDRRRPTTAVITQIVYGDPEKDVRLVEKDGNERTMPRKEFTEKGVLETNREVPNEFENIAYAVLESDCPLCEKGLQIVDTPGFRASVEAAAITQNYLKHVDALLIVLSNYAPFNDTERDIIDSIKRIAGSELNHVFFLINTPNLDDNEKTESLAYARTILENEFDEARFERHVFVVDVRAALDAKCNKDTATDLEATGLPAFEQRIAQLLASDERADVILDAAVCDVLIPNLASASAYIEKHTVEVSEETNQGGIEDKLARLEQEANAIQDTFDNFTNEVANTVASDLISYLKYFVDESNPEWQALNIEPGVLKLAASNFSSETRNKLAYEIAGQLTKYFDENIPDLQNWVFNSVKEKMKSRSEALEKKIATFIREISTAETSLPISELRNTLDENNQRRINQLSSQVFELTPDLISGLVRREVLLPTGVLTTLGAALIGALIPFNLIGRLLLAGGMLSISALLLLVRANKLPVKTRIREQLQTKVREKAGAIKAEIRQSVNERGRVEGDKLQAVLRAEIDHLQEQSNPAAIQKNRLETINALLTQEFEAICQATYGRVLTHQEQQQFLKNGS